MYDIAIIGGGVVGGMIARRLSAFDLKICILDKENYLDESLKLLTFIGFVIVYDYQISSYWANSVFS